MVSQVFLKFGYRNFSTVKNARGKSSVNSGFLKNREEVLARTGTTRRDQWYIALLANGSELDAIVTAPDSILIHAVEHNLACTAFLHFVNPIKRSAFCGLRFFGITRVLIHEPVLILFAAVNPDNNALRAEACRQLADQVWVGQGRGVDGDLVCALVQNVFRVRDALDSSGNTKRDIEES